MATPLLTLRPGAALSVRDLGGGGRVGHSAAALVPPAGASGRLFCLIDAVRPAQQRREQDASDSRRPLP